MKTQKVECKNCKCFKKFIDEKKFVQCTYWYSISTKQTPCEFFEEKSKPFSERLKDAMKIVNAIN